RRPGGPPLGGPADARPARRRDRPPVAGGLRHRWKARRRPRDNACRTHRSGPSALNCRSTLSRARSAAGSATVVGARSAQSPALQEPGRGPHGHPPVARSLGQPAPPPLGSRLLVTDQLREEDALESCLDPKSLTVHGSGTRPNSVCAANDPGADWLARKCQIVKCALGLALSLIETFDSAADPQDRRRDTEP